LCRDLDQRVDGGDRLRGHAALEPIAHRLRGERRGEERGDEEDQPHRLTARTITIEFSRPKLSATSRSARWSGIQRSPSTTNMYSYVPAGRTRAPRHTPSWSGPSSAIVPVRQSLNDPTTCTERARRQRPPDARHHPRFEAGGRRGRGEELRRGVQALHRAPQVRRQVAPGDLAVERLMDPRINRVHAWSSNTCNSASRARCTRILS